MRLGTMVRKATAEDTERLIEMGERFVSETAYKDLVSTNPERIAEVVAWLLANPSAVVLVSVSGGACRCRKDSATGMIGMIAYDHPFSGERTAFEIAWWVEPEARGDGVRLLRAAEAWAREQGARKMQMVAPTQRVGAFYERLGYNAVETSYQRSL